MLARDNKEWMEAYRKLIAASETTQQPEAPEKRFTWNVPEIDENEGQEFVNVSKTT